MWRTCVTSLCVALLFLSCNRTDDVTSETPEEPLVTESFRQDARPVVIVFSFTGRTAVVADLLANLVAVSATRYAIRPPLASPAAAPGIAAIAPEGLPGVPHLPEGTRQLFLGFPIWHAAPPPAVLSWLDSIDLTGCAVLPFFTYLHDVQSEALEALASRIKERGGVPLAPLAVRVSLSSSRDSILAATLRELNRRVDIVGGSFESPSPDCSPGTEGTAEVRCLVPAGWAFVPHSAISEWVNGPGPTTLEWVAPFRIDQGEVTQAQYRRCEEQGACPRVRFEGTSCEILQGDDLPIPCISQVAAQAYCAWKGARLPTAAQWARSVRGQGTMPYPWGNESPLDGRRGNFSEPRETALQGRTAPEFVRAKSDGYPGLAPSCSFPDGISAWGVCDLAGNLTEWLQSDETGVAPVVGGSWDDWSAEAIALEGITLLPDQLAIEVIGFRCVWDVAQ